MIEDIKLIEAVERYISGQMTPDERVYFEQLRKSNPEVDQAVVEHTFFMQQMNRFEETRKFKGILNDTHIHLAEKGEIKSPKLKGRARVIYLYNRYKRVSAIAASIAGITALTISALVWSLSPGKPISAVKDDVEVLKRKFNALEKTNNYLQKSNQILTKKIDDVRDQPGQGLPAPIPYTSGGTGFLIDNRGYVVTNAHVIENAKNIAVQGSDGKELNATAVYADLTKDLAILKIVSKEYRSPGTIPYSIKKNAGDLAEPIFTLGFPRNEIVYGQGYVAAKTGFQGDSLALQITIAANEGNSGGPVLNRNGEVIGVLTGKQKTAEGAVFAIQSKYIFAALNELQKDTAFQNVKMPGSSVLRGAERTQQVKKISDFVYMVKVN
ncbi:MAG TPA: serine protease [Flavisolibacter sp.]|nr:serine protease [Flavisolibacter sp.]